MVVSSYLIYIMYFRGFSVHDTVFFQEPKTELQKNAIASARKQELEVNQRAYDMEWLNNRMEDGRMGRLLALIQREADMEKDFQEVGNTRPYREKSN